MGRPDLRTVRPDFNNFTRAQANAYIASEEAKLAKQPPLKRRRIRAGRGSRGTIFRLESSRSFRQRQGIRNAQNNTIRSRIRSAKGRLATLDRKEKITELGTKDQKITTFEARGPSARALARAKKRRQTGVVKRTAARRGRQKKVTKIVKGSRCKARLAQDVGSLTQDEALCELNEKARFDERRPVKIGGRRINERIGGIKLSEREARLLIKVASPRTKRVRTGRGRRARTRTVTVGKGRGNEIFGFTSGLLSQAKAGISIFDFIKSPSNQIRETRRIGGRSSGSIVTTSRSKFRGSELNIMRSRANFLLAGGSSGEFDTILAGDIANRQSGRSAVRSVSGGSVRLNKATVDPFFRGSVSQAFLRSSTSRARAKAQAAQSVARRPASRTPSALRR